MAYDPTQSQMPMAQALLPMPGSPAPLPLPTGKPQVPPPTTPGQGFLPLPGASPAGPATPMPPLPQAPAQPPAPSYDVRLQPDGSSVYVMPSPDGDPSKDIILGVNKAPAVPKAMQAPVGM